MSLSVSSNGVAPSDVEGGQTVHVSDSVAILMDRGGARAESIGVVRAQLLSQHINNGRRALAVCATQANVGCTSLAVNLAVALGQVGLKTLLIDADLRQPGVDSMIAPPERVPGLVQCLEDEQLHVADAIQHDVLPGLSILYSGGGVLSPQELLARARFKTIVDQCMRDYEITIIDAPPSNSSADARRIASVAGYALIVVGRNRTFVHDVELLTQELRADQTTVIGTVLVDG